MQATKIVEYLLANPPICEFVLVDENGRRAGDVGSFVVRLLRANGGFLEPTERRASNFLGSGCGETRAVGAEINALYGFGGMIAVHEIVASLLPDGTARELEAAWSRIGEWQG